jgi:hypothetical protein
MQTPVSDPYRRGRERDRGGLLELIQGNGGADRNDGGSDARDEKRANVRVPFEAWTGELSAAFARDQAVN